MNEPGGKGDKRRPMQVSQSTFDENFDRIFRHPAEDAAQVVIRGGKSIQPDPSILKQLDEDWGYEDRNA